MAPGSGEHDRPPLLFGAGPQLPPSLKRRTMRRLAISSRTTTTTIVPSWLARRASPGVPRATPATAAGGRAPLVTVWATRTLRPWRSARRSGAWPASRA
jgi:hypothetical protein